MARSSTKSPAAPGASASTKVRVTIYDPEGKTLEQGEARRTFGDAWWEFEPRTGGNIRVEVWDLAGNAARQEA